MGVPKVGDKVYVPTSLYLTHGCDDFRGGVCTVSGVREGFDGRGGDVYISVEEDPGTWHNCGTYLEPQQEKFKAQYGDQKGHADPDYRPEFNEDL